MAFTDPGQRFFRYVDRQLGLTAAGRQARFQAMLRQGQQEYAKAAGPRAFRRVDYPAKQRLLAHRAESLAAIEAALRDGAGDRRFYLDLLLSMDAATAREALLAALQGGYGLNIPGIIDSLRARFSDAELQDLALTLPGPSRHTAYAAVREKDQGFQAQFWLQPRNQDERLLGSQLPRELLRALYPRFSRRGKLTAIRLFARDWPRGAPEWRELLAQESDPAARQEIFYQLNDTAALLAELERYGAFPGNSFWQYWGWERELAAQYPGSFLARGIRAYEAVRGRPYFEWDRVANEGDYWPRWEHGNRFYEPEREIPGWLGYLAAYRHHPAADDAAYRLGRSYEIQGDYLQAVRWLYAATALPDGEMAYHARGRIIWILDALLDEAQLQALAAANRIPDLEPALGYSLAVRALRAGRYDEAVRELDAVLARYGAAPLPERLAAPHSPYSGWRYEGFWHRVREQREQAARLRDLAGRTDPESRYELAATMHHDEFLFYNHLWALGRQTYLSDFAGHALAALQGDMDSTYHRWVAESNNYIQAAAAFAPLAGAPATEPAAVHADIAARAAYSRALALTKLLHYGPDVTLWRSYREIHDQAVAAFEQVVSDFPRHPLAADALLSLGFLRQDRSYFDRILREYPRSDAAATARAAALPDYQPYSLYTALPFRYIRLGEAPAEVQEWVRTHLAQAYTGSLSVGDSTYLLASSGRQTGWVDLRLTEDPDGSLRVGAWVPPRPGGGTGYALARIPATRRPIRFE